MSHPALIEDIKATLHKLQGTGAPLTVVSVRAVLVAKILDLKLEILQHQFKDGSFFRVSDSFVRKWMHDALHWSRRKATRAAHKLPVDWEAQCERAFLRKAYAIKQYDIPASLYVNSDQTNIVYAPGDKMTWASEGDKQVSIAGRGQKTCIYHHGLSIMQRNTAAIPGNLQGKDRAIFAREGFSSLHASLWSRLLL